MHRPGHLGVTLLLFAPVGHWLVSGGYRTLALLLAATMLSLAMLPDVDIVVPGLPHRGPTHSLLFAVAVGGVVAGAASQVQPAFPVAVPADISMTVIGFLLGFGTVLAHLLADVITPLGVPFLWPSSRRWSLNVVPSSDRTWNLGLLVVGVASSGWSLGLAFGFV